ncbi:MAG TPA: hypothetical protein VHX49_06015 [Candidatus Acidoferrales bacterium]|jgi:hypothetical protein|nr:hypothetical protein [Candidatus Acidoferrales bacterium]
MKPPPAILDADGFARGKSDYMLLVKQRSGWRFAPSFYVGPEGPTP